jgi:hypothetical protein
VQLFWLADRAAMRGAGIRVGLMASTRDWDDASATVSATRADVDLWIASISLGGGFSLRDITAGHRPPAHRQYATSP